MLRPLITKKRYFFVLSILLFNIVFVNGQDVLKNKYLSLDVSNKRFPQVLNEITEKTNVNFVYSNEILKDTKVVTLKATNATMSQLLDILCSGAELNYKEINGQIVLFKIKEKESTNTVRHRSAKKGNDAIDSVMPVDNNINNPGQESEEFELEAVSTLVKIYDTIITYVHDTLITTLVDTVNIELVDTINLIITDTIIIYDTIRPALKSDIGLFDRLSFSVELQGTSYPFQTLNNELTNPEYAEYLDLWNNSVVPAPGYSVGININANVDRWNIKSGVAFTRYSDKFSYFFHWKDKLKQIRVTDTLEIYFEIIESDTTWNHITRQRDTLVTIQEFSLGTDSLKQNFEKSNLNKYTYIEFPLIFGFDIPLKPQLLLQVEAGLITNMLVEVEGTRFKNSWDTIQPVNKAEFNKFIFALHGSLGVYYRINKMFGIYGKMVIRNNLNSMYKNTFFIHENRRAIGIQAGIRYYLN